MTAYGIRNPQAPDADMPKGSVDPKTESLLFAHLTDIRRGWAAAPLSFGERQALILRYGADLPNNDAGALQWVTDRAARYRRLAQRPELHRRLRHRGIRRMSMARLSPERQRLCR
ncbi:hypothetical protein [Streptomyces sp. NPDC023327]|uniref:hypothetical protein n=1 Tax=Streptomyces sp. NPDC023327 TaxID=3157088 RepID=UPI0033BFDFAA